MKNRLVKLAENADACEALMWLRNITKNIGPGFHPDIFASDYISNETGDASFTATCAKRLDKDLDRMFELLGAAGKDPYAIAGRVQRRLLGMKRSNELD